MTPPIGYDPSPRVTATLAKFTEEREPPPPGRGMHALSSGMDVKAYAASVGRKYGTVINEVYAAKVATAVSDVGNAASSHFSNLVEIHAAPEWLWPAMVEAMVAENWTVEATPRNPRRARAVDTARTTSRLIVVLPPAGNDNRTTIGEPPRKGR